MIRRVEFVSSYTVFVFILTICLSVPLPALSQAIDWEDGIAPGGVGGSLGNESRSRTNLPGVRLVPSSPATRARPDCDDRIADLGQTGSSDLSVGDCNPKTPLIVLRDGQIGGLVFEFGR